MKLRFQSVAVLLSIVLAAGGTAASAAAPKSPDAVKNALRVLAYVQSDMASKLPSHSYARLPHECQEFQQASQAMRDAVAGDPAQFKSQVASALGKALAASDRVAEISSSNDEAGITTAVAAVDAALQDLNKLFPEALRPVPGQLGRGPGRGPGGPPADLR